MASREENELALAATFNNSAEIYDKFRPDYPDSLYEVITGTVQPAVQTAVLEIGCGTGQATVAMAQRGYNITVVEPGENLAAIARQKLEGYPNARVITSSFEDVDLTPESFDLLLAAMSLHWVRQDDRFRKPNELLKPGGFLAILYNWPVLTEEARPFYESLAEIMSRHSLPEDALMPTTEEEIAIRPTIDTALFKDPKFFLQSIIYRYNDPMFYVGYLATLSNVADIPEKQRHSFLYDVLQLTQDEKYENFELPFVSTLAISQKKKLSGSNQAAK